MCQRVKNTFGFLLIDGLAKQEEAFVSALYRNLGDIQLFGGSAADGLNFQKNICFSLKENSISTPRFFP